MEIINKVVGRVDKSVDNRFIQIVKFNTKDKDGKYHHSIFVGAMSAEAIDWTKILEILKTQEGNIREIGIEILKKIGDNIDGLYAVLQSPGMVDSWVWGELYEDAHVKDEIIKLIGIMKE